MENELKCPVCSREDFASETGLKMHITRSHKNGSDKAADEVFELLGKATAILFPNPSPSRYIEIGEWQKATLRLLSRQ